MKKIFLLFIFVAMFLAALSLASRVLPPKSLPPWVHKVNLYMLQIELIGHKYQSTQVIESKKLYDVVKKDIQSLLVKDPSLSDLADIRLVQKQLSPLENTAAKSVSQSLVQQRNGSYILVLDLITDGGFDQELQKQDSVQMVVIQMSLFDKNTQNKIKEYGLTYRVR